MHIEGACHCGHIRFSAEVDPARVTACHCTDCQMLSGSAFRVVVPAPIESFVLHGEPRRYIKVAESGARRVQAFCGECGTPLFAAPAESPAQVMIRTSCVNERDALPPKQQVWLRSSQPWLAGLAGLPGLAKQPAPAPAPTGT